MVVRLSSGRTTIPTYYNDCLSVLKAPPPQKKEDLRVEQTGQDSEKKVRKKPKKTPAERFQWLDKNKDGGITLEEIKVNPYWKKQPEAAAKMFKNKDKDANGKLSKEEFTAKPTPKKKKEGQPTKKKGADKKKDKSK